MGAHSQSIVELVPRNAMYAAQPKAGSWLRHDPPHSIDLVLPRSIPLFITYFLTADHVE